MMKHFFSTIVTVIVTLNCQAEDHVHCYSTQRFIYRSDTCDLKLTRACHIADSILSLPSFWNQVRSASNQNITNSNYSMQRLADTLQAYRQVTVIEVFPNQDEGSTTAITDTADLVQIYKRGYDQSTIDLALTLIHEWVHSVDYGTNKGNLQFAHRTPQTRWWNRNTASYRIEKIAEAFLPKN